MHFGVVILVVIATVLEAVPAPQRAETKPQLRCAEESRKRFKIAAARIGGDVKPPRKLIDAHPDYANFPPDTTVSGMWIGEALVGDDGSVVDIWVIREPRLKPHSDALNRAILNAIKKWKYDPVIVDGKEVPFCMTVTVNIDVS
jgi:outer membrane biosynthesis protein TonB